MKAASACRQRTKRVAHPCVRGFTLLEVLVALTLLALVGGGVLGLTIQAATTARQVERAEAAMRRANAFFASAALWPREDLDRHLGDRREGEWILTVRHSSPLLYELRLTDSLTGRPVLATRVYRPEMPAGAGQ